MPSEPTTVIMRPAAAEDAPAILALQRRAFSPGRFARTAYRVREGTPLISPFCRVAVADGQMIASLRMTAITIGGKGGSLLLGPLAVDPDHAGRGYGRRLVSEGLAAARAAGIRLVVLVGDLAYYGRLGFETAPPGKVLMPGPVDPARLLVAELTPGALAEVSGLVRAA